MAKKKAITKQQEEKKTLSNAERLDNLIQQRTQLEIALTKIQGAIEVMAEVVKGEEDGEKTKG